MRKPASRASAVQGTPERDFLDTAGAHFFESAGWKSAVSLSEQTASTG